MDDDDFVTYVETEDEKQKPRYVRTGDASAALTNYYDAVHTLCEAQQNFAKSTQVLEKENNRQRRFPRYYQAGTIAICKSGDQNNGRNGEA